MCQPLNINMKPKGPQNCSERVGFCCGYTVPIILLCLIIAIYVGHAATFIQIIMTYPDTAWKIALSVVFLLLVTLMLFLWFYTYFQIVTTPPGYVPRAIWQFPPHIRNGAEESEGESSAAEEATARGPREEAHVRSADGTASVAGDAANPPANPFGVRVLGPRGSLRFCNFCQMYKPDHAFHCKTCGRCVYLFDHHCPWINNCVGRNNYVLFIAFILNSCVALGTVVVSLSLGMFVMDFDSLDFNGKTIYRAVDLVFSFILMLSLLLFGLQFLCLYKRGMSTVESFITTQQYTVTKRLPACVSGRRAPPPPPPSMAPKERCNNGACPGYPFPETREQRRGRVQRNQTALLGPAEQRSWWRLLVPKPVRTDDGPDELEDAHDRRKCNGNAQV